MTTRELKDRLERLMDILNAYQDDVRPEFTSPHAAEWGIRLEELVRAIGIVGWSANALEQATGDIKRNIAVKLREFADNITGEYDE